MRSSSQTFHATPAALVTKRKGFSLVEVVLALGILSFAVIPILGLIGGSLQSYRGAIHDTVSRQIMTQLAANAQQARLSDLLDQPQETYYFDYEGGQLSGSGPETIYTANVTSIPDNDLLNSSNLFRVQIRVTPLDQSGVQYTSLRVLPQN